MNIQMRDAIVAWVMDWYEVDREAAEHILKCDDGTAVGWAFEAGAEWASKQCSHKLCADCVAKVFKKE